MVTKKGTRGGDELVAVCGKARRAAAKALRQTKHWPPRVQDTVTDEEWAALRRVCGTQMPAWSGADENEEKKAAKRVTAASRELTHAVAQQIEVATKAEQRGMHWMREREEKREYLRMCMRAWREAVNNGSELNVKLWLRELAHGTQDETHTYGLRRRNAVVSTEHKYFVMKVRSGPRHTQAVAVAHSTWWRRLRSTVRGVLTWVALVGKRERARTKIRARWRHAYEMVRDEIRACADVAATPVPAPAVRAGTRSSERLGTVPTPQYREAREWNGRDEQGGGRRRAVAAVHSTRVGIRLKQWLERSSDAGGPGSIKRGDG